MKVLKRSDISSGTAAQRKHLTDAIDMKDIAIYGAGGLGREVASMIKLINQTAPNTWNLVGFFDDGVVKGTQISNFGQVYGGMSELNSWRKELNVVFAIGNPNTLMALTDRVSNKKILFPNLLAPDLISFGPTDEKLGKGNIICLGCVLSSNVQLGDFNVLNGYITVGHDAHLGNYNVIMPGARLSGDIKVGNCNLFGANSFVLQGLKIGQGIKLAPCSALMHNPKNESDYLGVPAKLLRF